MRVSAARSRARGFTSVAVIDSAWRGQVQGLHAAAGAEIECRADRPPDGELGQGAGRRRQPEHEVRTHRRDVAVQARGQVGEHPEVGCRRWRTGAGPPPLDRPCVGGRAGSRPGAADRPDRAAPPRAARSTGRCSGHSRIRVASGSSRPASARSAGTVWLRPSAACATGPIASTTGIDGVDGGRRGSAGDRRAAADGSSTAPCWHSGPMKVALITIRAVPSRAVRLALPTCLPSSLGRRSFLAGLGALGAATLVGCNASASGAGSEAASPSGAGTFSYTDARDKVVEFAAAGHHGGRAEQRRRHLARLRLSGGRGVRRAEARRRQAQLSGRRPRRQQDHGALRRVRRVRRGEVRGHEPAGADRPDVRAGRALVPAGRPADEGRAGLAHHRHGDAEPGPGGHHQELRGGGGQARRRPHRLAGDRRQEGVRRLRPPRPRRPSRPSRT